MNQDKLMMNPTTNSTTNPSVEISPETWQKASNKAHTLMDAVGRSVIGQRDIIEQLCICLIAGGHARS